MVEAMYDADATKTICVVRKTVMVVKDGIRFDPKKFYTAVGVRP